MIYTPRLDYTGTDTLAYYTTLNAYQGVNAMPNCVAYTYGRWNELSRVESYEIRFPTGNGNQWFAQGVSMGFLHGRVPQVGACICWDGGSQGYGHTAIVERLYYDENGNVESFTISQSADAEPRYPQNSYPWFWLGRVYVDNLDYLPVYQFQGFLYHPSYPPEGQPVISSADLWAILFRNVRKHRNIFIRS